MTPEQQAKVKALRNRLLDSRNRLEAVCEEVELFWCDVNQLEQELDKQGDARRSEVLSKAQEELWEARRASFKAFALVDSAHDAVFNMDRVTL